MIVVLNRNLSIGEKEKIISFLVGKGFQTREIQGEEETVLGAVGKSGVDIREVEALPGVARVIPISKPYKLASRELKKEDSVVHVGGVAIGGKRIAIIAGPCAVESRTQIMEIAECVAKSGAVLLRGGAFKPRTSPYAFQGLEEEGLKYLKEAGEKWGLPVVTEITTHDALPIMQDYVDILQVGARNMQNFELLKRIGQSGKPVLLKRGFASTVEDWLMAAEYLLAHGSEDVILCERGIRTFEQETRNTLDLSVIPVLKKLTHLPVIVDPSHATGRRDSVIPMSLAAISAGACGLEVEVHNHPEKAFSDGPQSLYPEQFEKLMRDIQVLAPVVGKEVALRPVAPIILNFSKKPGDSRGVRGPKVAFQGEHGAYAESALFQHFESAGVESCSYHGFKAVFDAVLSTECEFGILPVENSLAGSVHENFDLFLQYPDIHIEGETRLRVEHHLIGYEGVDPGSIKKVYSHPQALAQCSRFLDTLDGVERIPVQDTSGAVKMVVEGKDKSCAAIGSERAAAIWKMSILKSGLETNPKNYTRFVIIKKGEPKIIPSDTKVSIVFAIKDNPGSLYSVLSIFAEAKLNLNKLESRPILGKPWAYMFYLDVELGENKETILSVLEKIQGSVDNVRVLGFYEGMVG